MTANELELGTGVLQYGGFRFPNAIKARIAARPMDDSTSRFTKYVVHRVEIETVLYPGVDEHSPSPFFPASADSADGLNNADAMDGVRRVLSTRGLELIFDNKGYGGFLINTSDQDVLAGPNPEILIWEPIGDNFAVRIVWGVEVTLSRCLLIGNLSSLLTEFSYSISWGIDLAGLTTRTISGHWEIVLNITGGSVTNNADQKRDLIVFDIPTGFARTQQNYTLNERRDRMDFSIVDTEYAADDQNRMPKGVVEINVKQTTRNDGSLVHSRWNTTISGTITVAKGQPRHLAWIAFINIVDSRIQRAKEKGNVPNDSQGNPESYQGESVRANKVIILRSLSISEDIYGRSMTFSVVWTSFTSARTIIESAGFFTRIPGATERGQITSLIAPNEAWTTRGPKRLSWRSGEPLVGICESQVTLSLQNDSRRDFKAIGEKMFSTEKPSAGESWICWESKVIEDKQTNRYASFPANGLLPADESSLNISSEILGRTRIGSGTGSNLTQLPTIHTSGGHYSILTFVGSAARLGYAIPEVHLLKYGGGDVTPVGTQTQVNLDPVDAGGVLLFRSSWVKEYMFKTQPNDNKKSISTSPSPQQVNSNCEAGFQFQQR